jgi:hypothetical protein
MEMQRVWQMGLVLVVSFLLPRQLTAQPLQKNAEEAKKEEKLVFYTVLTLPNSQALLKGFSFGILGQRQGAQISAHAQPSNRRALGSVNKG